MKITAKRILSLILSVILVFGVCSFGAAAQVQATIDEDTQGFTSDDFLTVKGRKMFNKKGQEVVLHGVNLGGWLIHEDWLCPDELNDVQYDNETILEILTERFGLEEAYELIDIYQENWITEYDLDQIKEMGFNCVRVPFWYRNFYYDDDGTKILDDNGDWDFSILDWVVEECSKRELYVILDMHGAVGSQSDAPHSGRAYGGAQLYENSEQGERYRELTDELWTAIASRFNGNPAVAMYDLLNEPMCDVDCTEIKRRINNESIYTRLYNTVRAADPDHIITMEAIWTGFALPKTFLKGWTNVVYQVHFYNNSDFIFNFFLLLTIAIHPNIPLMVGEFYPHEKTTWENCFKTMNKLNYSWMLWTYKATGHGMWDSDWCIYGSKDGFWRAKIQTGTYEEIADAWGSRIKTENGFQSTGHYERDVASHV